MLSFTHQDSLLHKALKEYDNRISLENIIHHSTAGELNQLDAAGLTPLQRVALEGRSDIILWMVDGGADVNRFKSKTSKNLNVSEAEKPPLLLAMEHCHWLTAQILLICGADKKTACQIADHLNNEEVKKHLTELNVDIDIFRGIFFWILFHKAHGSLFEILLNQLQIPVSNVDSKDEKDAHPQVSQEFIQNDATGFAELAAKQEHYLIASGLAALNTIPSSSTIGYWAAIGDVEETYQLIEKNDEHVITTLHLLSQFRHDSLLSFYFKKASIKQQKAFLELDKKTDENELTPIQKKIYATAKFANFSHLNLYGDNYNSDYQKVTAYALLQKDYVALQELMLLNFNKDMLLTAFFNHNRKLLYLCMFAFNYYERELGTLFIKELHQLYQLLGSNLERESTFYQIISQGVSHSLKDNRPKLDKQFQIDFFKEAKVTRDEFISVYFRRIFRRNDITTLDNAKIWLTINNLIDSYSPTLISHAKRFGFDLSAFFPILNKKTLVGIKNMFRKSFDPANLMLKYLNAEDKRNLRMVSKSCYEFSMSSQLNIINHFLNMMEDEINHQPNSRNRNYSIGRTGKIVIIISLILLVGMSVSSYYFDKEAKHQNELTNRMDKIILEDQCSGSSCIQHTCGDLVIQANHFGKYCDPNFSTYALRNCGDPCAELRDNFEFLDNVLFPVVFSSVLSAIFHPCTAYLIFGLIKTAFKGRERFDSSPLASFSLALQRESGKVISEFSHLPHFNLTTRSTIQEWRSQLRTLKRELQAPRSRLFQHAIEIDSKSSSVMPAKAGIQSKLFREAQTI